jgi:hypothetical protein
MKEFKPGALVMIKHARNTLTKKYEGTYHTLVDKQKCVISGNMSWLVNPPTKAFVLDRNRNILWPENQLTLIDPGEGQDEMLLKTGLPKQKEMT